MTQTNWQVLKTGEAAHAPLPVPCRSCSCLRAIWSRLRLAVLYGADAVYLAGTTFGMRAFAGNFTETEMKEAVRFCARPRRARACYGEYYASQRRGGPAAGLSGDVGGVWS